MERAYKITSFKYLVVCRIFRSSPKTPPKNYIKKESLGKEDEK
jgi:hypothetical protein